MRADRCLFVLSCVFVALTAGGATHVVEIHNGSFSPSDVTIVQGDTVKWVWMASGHTTTSDAGQNESWDSGLQNQGSEFSHVFQAIGTFSYVCVPHAPHMAGSVTVQAPPKTDTTTAVSSSKNPSTTGENVNFTATVSAQSGTPAGTVDFFAGDAAMCSDVALTGASAICAKSDLGAGSHSITATYSGNDDFNGSTSGALTQTVTLAPPAAPASFSATATDSTTVALVWSAVAGATSYEVHRMTSPGVFAPLPSTTSVSMNDTGRSPDTSYVYKVRAINGGGSSDFSAADVATTITFTDEALTGVAVKALHVTQLRTAVEAMRAAAGLGSASYTDAPLLAGTRIKAAHITELRTLLDAARDALDLTTLSYSDSTLTSATPVRAAHVVQLRAGTQ